jgi:hypothetical protein
MFTFARGEVLTAPLVRYHKAHGHLNQQLHDNGDGTFSIINPETSTPYPGTEGMEKEKPFYCDMCNKRYKNPNGLKYVSAVNLSRVSTVFYASCRWSDLIPFSTACTATATRSRSCRSSRSSRPPAFRVL